MDQADLMFSRRVDDQWTPAQTLAGLPGKDEQARLAAGLNGEITTAWVNRSDDISTVYAAIWNGASWSQPVPVASAALAESPTLTYRSGRPLIVWGQDGDGSTDTWDDWRVYSSRWNGSSWTVPAPLEVEEAGADPTRSVQSRLVSRRRAIPPDSCCEKDPDDPSDPVPDDPLPPDPPDSIQEPVGESTAPVVVATDPNEKRATVADGDEQFVSPGGLIRYAIYFENLPRASAPSQEVLVTDCLDRNLDWPTLRVEEIAFGELVISNPLETAVLESRIAVPDYRQDQEKEWWVTIDTQFSAVSGCLEVALRTLDPETEDLPEDAFAGFLPPEDGTGRGQGHVTLSVRARSDLDMGVDLSNRASITFDTNVPILTNEAVNTVGSSNVPLLGTLGGGLVFLVALGFAVALYGSPSSPRNSSSPSSMRASSSRVTGPKNLRMRRLSIERR